MKCINANCGNKLAPDAKFCGDCGTPVANAQFYDNGFSNFMYLLHEEHLRQVDLKDIRPPFGAVGVTVVEGVVVHVHFPSVRRPEGGNVFAELLRSAKEFGLGLLGNKKQEVRTYIMMDLRTLPVVSHKIVLKNPGAQDSTLNFKFWVDVSNEKHIGLFLQRCVQSHDALSVSDFRQTAVQELEKNLNNQNLQELIRQEANLQSILQQLEASSGISGTCEYQRGVELERRDFALSQESSTVTCPNCHSDCGQFSRFCGKCGTSLNVSQFAESRKLLVTSDGEPLTARISAIFVDPQNSQSVSEEDFKIEIFTLLAAEFRRHTAASLRSPENLALVSSHIANQVTARWPGKINDFSIIDIASSTEGWLFNVDSYIEDELRNVDANCKALKIEQSELDLKEAAFAIALRRVRQNDTEQLALKRTGLDAKHQGVEILLEEHTLESTTELRREAIDDDVAKTRLERQLATEEREGSADLERLDRQIAKETREDAAEAQRLELERKKLAREHQVLNEEKGRAHADEIADFSHAADMEAKAHEHDISLRTRANEVNRMEQKNALEDQLAARRAEAQISLEEREQGLRISTQEQEDALRLAGKEREQSQRIEIDGMMRRGNVEEDIKDRQQARDLEKSKEQASIEATKLQAMAAIEAQMAEQDHSHDQSMAKIIQNAEIEKRKVMGHLDASQILAMQAAELARIAGEGQSSVEVVKSIAEAQSAASGVAIKEYMYQEMIRRQQESNDQLLTMQQSHVQDAFAASDRAMESMREVARVVSGGGDSGYKEAAKIAQSVNEKSMDAMAKVATSVANKKIADTKDSTSTDNKGVVCANDECDHVFKGKPGRFCPKCGLEQPKA